MNAVIRPATTADAPGIAHVHTQSWAETYRGLMPDAFLDRMTSEGAKARREESWRTQRITTDPARPVLGQGIGKALLHAIVHELQATGAKTMALWVLNATRHWYAPQGASEAGEKAEGELREIRMVWDDLGVLCP